MADEQGTVALSPQEAVDAEYARIIRAAEESARSRGVGSYRGWMYRIIRDLRPDITMERWREITSITPDLSQSQDVREVQQARNHDQRVQTWLRERGAPTCCPECNAHTVERLRRGGILPPWEGEESEPVVERTCTCDGCTGPECQGDCDQCDDHNCEQCYRDHEPSTCCGYCSECGFHPNDVDTPNYYRCAECDRCSECEHYCGD